MGAFTSQEPAESERQVVALHVAGETYGVDIEQIETVIPAQTITVVPKAPHFIKGVINLRGRIVPVIDLRARFSLPALAAEHARSARIVIVEIEGYTAGLMADSVSEVFRLTADCISPPSQLVKSAGTECITAIGSSDGRLILLLDVHKTLTTCPQGVEDSDPLPLAA